MRMQKEEKIVVVLLLMALGSLAVAFWAFAPYDGEQGGSFSSESQMSASSGICIEGQVLEIKPTRSGGNLLLKLDGSELAIFIPAKAGAKELLSRIKLGDRLSVRGTLSSYQDSEELVVSKKTDVQVLTT
jgi:hypothetical protein